MKITKQIPLTMPKIVGNLVIMMQDGDHDDVQDFKKERDPF